LEIEMATEKYKLFRQYMTNELGIGRDEIEQWTKESVAETVNKLVGSMNIELMAQHVVRAAVMGSGYDPGRLIREELAKQLASQIQITITEPR
jgi:hypothetical protein